jgi:hypothetical protein
MENKDFFEKNKYLILRSAISQELRDFVTQYALFDEMQDLTPEKAIAGSNAICPEAHSKYGDPAMESMLLLLHPIMEQAVGFSLFPTYCYYRVYRNNDGLPPHVDRPSCEISATVCLNFNYDPDKVWSIYLDGNQVDLLPGDLAIYRGCEIPHWRELFNRGQDAWQVQAFFHYVDVNGPNAEWKWDKRPSLGVMGTGPSLDLLKEYKASKKSGITVAEKSYIQYTK